MPVVLGLSVKTETADGENCDPEDDAIKEHLEASNAALERLAHET